MGTEGARGAAEVSERSCPPCGAEAASGTVAAARRGPASTAPRLAASRPVEFRAAPRGDPRPLDARGWSARKAPRIAAIRRESGAGPTALPQPPSGGGAARPAASAGLRQNGRFAGGAAIGFRLCRGAVSKYNS